MDRELFSDSSRFSWNLSSVLVCWMNQVEKTEKPKTPKGRAKKRLLYNRRCVRFYNFSTRRDNREGCWDIVKGCRFAVGSM